MSVLLNGCVINDEILADRLTTLIVRRFELNTMTSRQIAEDVVGFLSAQRPKDWPHGDAQTVVHAERASS